MPEFRTLSAVALDVLRCPQCVEPLELRENGLHCTACGSEYPATSSQIDLRPRGQLTRTIEIAVLPPGARSPEPYPVPIATGAHAAIPYDSDDMQMSYGNRLTSALTTHIPPATYSGEVMLDVGCGTGALGQFLAERRGFHYLGVDYDDPSAPVLADAEALPVADGSTSVILSFAVLEHVRSPATIASEIARCLRPGGVFVGTVAFLEPFHLNSYFHHTHLGLRAVLGDAGLAIVGLEANRDWLGQHAISEMTAGSRVARVAVRSRSRLARAISGPWEKLRKRPDRLAAVTAGFRFVATKPT